VYCEKKFDRQISVVCLLWELID